jgi:hypothetical protein
LSIQSIEFVDLVTFSQDCFWVVGSVRASENDDSLFSAFVSCFPLINTVLWYLLAVEDLLDIKT